MNNKTLISFCVNILVGIIFSFPVISAQGYTGNAMNLFSSSNIAEQGTLNGEIHLLPKDSNLFGFSGTVNNITGAKLFGKNSSSGNKDNNRSESGTKITQYQIFHSPPVTIHTHASRQLNVSSLKDIWKTKMLR